MDSSAQLRRVTERNDRVKGEAFRQTSLNLSPLIGVKFLLTGWSRKAEAAYDNQWKAQKRHPDAAWDWPELQKKYIRDPSRLDIVIWGPDERLCGLGLGKMTSQAVDLLFLEREPAADCPLQGRVALIALDAAARFGQGCGRTELRVHPVNSSLCNLYCDTYGFTLVEPRKQDPYCRKGV